MITIKKLKEQAEILNFKVVNLNNRWSILEDEKEFPIIMKNESVLTVRSLIHELRGEDYTISNAHKVVKNSEAEKTLIMWKAI